MREVANQSAQSALKSYHSKRVRESARSTMTWAAVLFFVGLFCLLFVRALTPLAGWVGGGCAFALSGFLALVALARAARHHEPGAGGAPGPGDPHRQPALK
ncbi:MAG: hypothetical protein FJ297_18900 [Planctomycetes bacterium]|nr:hypothetical protein [Planctomycetota bacterium]